VDADVRAERLLIVGELVLGAVTGVGVVLAAWIWRGRLAGLEAGEIHRVDVLEVVEQVVDVVGDGIDILGVVGVLVDAPLVVVSDPHAAGGGGCGCGHDVRAHYGRSGNGEPADDRDCGGRGEPG